MAEQDLYLIVSQNNAKKQVKIKQASEELAKALGYLRSEMEGKLLSEYLGQKAANSLEEYLEYEDDSDDVDRVLGCVQHFTLKAHSGDELPFAHKIYREAPRDDKQWFQIQLKDERRQIQEQSLQSMLRENLAGVIAIDELTGLADRTSCERYLEQVASYVNSEHVTACFAVIRLDRYEKSCAHFGKERCEALVKHVASSCKAKFREEDLVCRLGEDTLGLLLMDTTEDTARVVLNRLRWFIASHRIAFADKPNFSVTISIVFTPLKPNAEHSPLLACEEVIDKVSEDERSQLVEA